MITLTTSDVPVLLASFSSLKLNFKQLFFCSLTFPPTSRGGFYGKHLILNNIQRLYSQPVTPLLFIYSFICYHVSSTNGPNVGLVTIPNIRQFGHAAQGSTLRIEPVTIVFAATTQNCCLECLLFLNMEIGTAICFIFQEDEICKKKKRKQKQRDKKKH